MDKQYINRKLNFVLSLATLVVRVQASFRLLWRTEVKWLHAALLGKTKGNGAKSTLLWGR